MSRLALSMIVRDAEKWLPPCLASVKGVVEELCIADTGSSDKSIEIARSFGANVASIVWNNDFAEARNHALAMVCSDWVLSLDADEQLDPAARKQIPCLLDSASSCDGFQVTIRNYVLSLNDRVWDRAACPNDSSFEAAKPYPALVEHENVRLFRRNSEIYFVGRVHESVGPRILETKGKLGRANFFIHHFGLAADEETRTRKNRFYRELGRQKIQEMPKSAQAHLELGLVELDNFGNLQEAQTLFEEACRLNPRFGLAWFFHGVALLKLDRPFDALACFRKARLAGHLTPLLSECCGDAHYNLGQFLDAARYYELALKTDLENAALRSKRGLAMVRKGDAEFGLRLLRDAVQSAPTSVESRDRLILACVWLHRIEDAAAVAQEKLQVLSHPTAGDFLRAASLWANSQNWARASASLQAGLAAYPENEKLQRAYAEIEQAAAIPNMANDTGSAT